MAAPITLQFIIDARRAKSGARDVTTGLKEIEKQAPKAGKAVEKTGRQIDAAATKAKRSRAGFDASARGMGVVGRAASGLGGQLKLLAGAYLGIQGARRAISTISEFETSIAQLRGVTGASGASLEQLVSTARETGSATRYTASEAAQGLLELSRAGLSVSQSTRALRPSLNLATAGMLSLAEASDLVTNVVSQFGLTVDDIEHVGDVLVTTANSSNTNVAQLGQGLKDVGIVAASMGVSLEESTAALGVLANRGLKGSDASIKLRQALLQLLDPSTDAARTLADLSLSVSDVDVRSRGLEAVLRTLYGAQIDIADAAQLVGTRNASALVALSENVDEYREFTKENKASHSAMRDVASIMDDTLMGAFKRLGSAFDDLILNGGDDGLLGVLRDIVEGLTEVTRAAAKASTAIATVVGSPLPDFFPGRSLAERINASPEIERRSGIYGTADPNAPRSGAYDYETRHAPAPIPPRANQFDVDRAVSGTPGQAETSLNSFDRDWSFLNERRRASEEDLQEVVSQTPRIIQSLTDGIGQLGAAALMGAGDMREAARILLESLTHQMLSQGISSGVSGLIGGIGGGGLGAGSSGGGGGAGSWSGGPGTGGAGGGRMFGGGNTVIINGGDTRTLSRTVRQELQDQRSRWLRRR